MKGQEQTDPLRKAVHRAGQQQQEHSIHYVQETLETSMAGEGGGAGADSARRVERAAGPWLVSVHELQSGENSDLQRALGSVSPVVDINRGKPEDNSKDEGRTGECK